MYYTQHKPTHFFFSPSTKSTTIKLKNWRGKRSKTTQTLSCFLKMWRQGSQQSRSSRNVMRVTQTDSCLVPMILIKFPFDKYFSNYYLPFNFYKEYFNSTFSLLKHFSTLAYCSSCPYSTKVRVNFVRHLLAHQAANEKPNDTKVIPSSDPVNPVPCLERKELMFDKMTNWAGSSHENKT